MPECQKGEKPLNYSFDQGMRGLHIPTILVQQCFLCRVSVPFPLGFPYDLSLFWAHITPGILGGSHIPGITLRALSYVAGIGNVAVCEEQAARGGEGAPTVKRVLTVRDINQQ